MNYKNNFVFNKIDSNTKCIVNILDLNKLIRQQNINNFTFSNNHICNDYNNSDYNLDNLDNLDDSDNSNYNLYDLNNSDDNLNDNLDDNLDDSDDNLNNNLDDNLDDSDDSNGNLDDSDDNLNNNLDDSDDKHYSCENYKYINKVKINPSIENNKKSKKLMKVGKVGKYKIIVDKEGMDIEIEMKKKDMKERIIVEIIRIRKVGEEEELRKIETGFGDDKYYFKKNGDDNYVDIMKDKGNYLEKGIMSEWQKKVKKKQEDNDNIKIAITEWLINFEQMLYKDKVNNIMEIETQIKDVVMFDKNFIVLMITHNKKNTNEGYEFIVNIICDCLGSIYPKEYNEGVGYFTVLAKRSKEWKDNIYYIMKRDITKNITYYINKTCPIHLINIVKHSILQWNKAFQNIGCGSIIRVVSYIEPDYPSNFNDFDIKYNVIIFSPNISCDVLGLTDHIIDRHTGHIIKSYIQISLHTIINKVYRISLLNPTIINSPIDIFHPYVISELVYTVIHEIGHSLGLKHNFSTPNNISNSVMNYIQTPDLSNFPFLSYNDHLLAIIGPYDYYAIKFGYSDIKLFDNNTYNIEYDNINIVSDNTNIVSDNTSNTNNTNNIGCENNIGNNIGNNIEYENRNISEDNIRKEENIYFETDENLKEEIDPRATNGVTRNSFITILNSIMNFYEQKKNMYNNVKYNNISGSEYTNLYIICINNIKEHIINGIKYIAGLHLNQDHKYFLPINKKSQIISIISTNYFITNIKLIPNSQEYLYFKKPCDNPYSHEPFSFIAFYSSIISDLLNKIFEPDKLTRIIELSECLDYLNLHDILNLFTYGPYSLFSFLNNSTQLCCYSSDIFDSFIDTLNYFDSFQIDFNSSYIKHFQLLYINHLLSIINNSIFSFYISNHLSHLCFLLSSTNNSYYIYLSSIISKSL